MKETRLQSRITNSIPPTLALQRKCACGKGCAKCSDSTEVNDALPQPARTGFGHDFSQVRVFPGNVFGAQDQTQSGGLDEKFMQTDNQATDPVPQSPQDINPGEEKYHAPVIDSVELVTSSSGAVGGYPAVEDLCDGSMNNPGPYNDIWAKGSVANFHQVQFHLSQGSPTDVRAKRVVNRTSSGQGQQQPPKTGDDGPPPHEYQFTKDKLVIGDAPGYCRTLRDGDFPVTYKADFGCYAFDPLDNRVLASIAYHVEISKTYYGQIDPVNTVTVTEKKIGGGGVASPLKPKPPGN